MEYNIALRGINFKQKKPDQIFVGIHLDTFIEQATQLINPDGWVNFTIDTLRTPHSKGYTHKAVKIQRNPAKDKNNGSIDNQ